jgi:outer membrane immunogenic protein
MKRLALLAALSVIGGQALAADLAPPISPAIQAPSIYFPVAPVYSWTGFYVGGNLGAGWNKASFSDSAGSTFSTSGTTTTFLGGGQFGANYQFGPSGSGVVVGTEAMFDWLPNTKNTITATNGVSTATATVNNRWLTTATGKLGYAWDRVLLYGKGGFAWISNSSSSAIIGGTSFGVSSNSTNWGWTGGIGVEWAFAGNWSVRAEYDFVGLQNQTFGVSSTAPAPFTNDTISINNRSIQMITAGVNYKLYGPGAW